MEWSISKADISICNGQSSEWMVRKERKCDQRMLLLAFNRREFFSLSPYFDMHQRRKGHLTKWCGKVEAGDAVDNPTGWCQPESPSLSQWICFCCSCCSVPVILLMTRVRFWCWCPWQTKQDEEESFVLVWKRQKEGVKGLEEHNQFLLLISDNVVTGNSAQRMKKNATRTMQW